MITKLSSWKEKKVTISKEIKNRVSAKYDLQFLEAGCGRNWGIELEDVQYTLTGLDVDENALNMRKEQNGDLDIAINGDLRNYDLGENKYDLIFCSNVLEHVDGAKLVLKNFIRWLKPGGIIVLMIPNRDSVKGFLSRITPFWIHVIYSKYFIGLKNAGKSGHGPYPVCFDKVVSLRGIKEFCAKHNLIIRKEYYMSLNYRGKMSRPYWIFSMLIVWLIHLVSLGKLSIKFSELVFIIESK